MDSPWIIGSLIGTAIIVVLSVLSLQSGRGGARNNNQGGADPQAQNPAVQNNEPQGPGRARRWAAALLSTCSLVARRAVPRLAGLLLTVTVVVLAYLFPEVSRKIIAIAVPSAKEWSAVEVTGAVFALILVVILIAQSLKQTVHYGRRRRVAIVGAGRRSWGWFSKMLPYLLIAGVVGFLAHYYLLPEWRGNLEAMGLPIANLGDLATSALIAAVVVLAVTGWRKSGTAGKILAGLTLLLALGFWGYNTLDQRMAGACDRKMQHIPMDGTQKPIPGECKLLYLASGGDISLRGTRGVTILLKNGETPPPSRGETILTHAQGRPGAVLLLKACRMSDRPKGWDCN